MHLYQCTVFTKSLNSVLWWSLSAEEEKFLNFPAGLYLFWQKLCRDKCTKAGLAIIKMICYIFLLQFSVLPVTSGRAMQNWMLTDFIWAVERTLLEFRDLKGHQDLRSLHHHYWNKKAACLPWKQSSAKYSSLLWSFVSHFWNNYYFLNRVKFYKFCARPLQLSDPSGIPCDSGASWPAGLLKAPSTHKKGAAEIKCNFTSEPNTSFGYQEAEQLGRKFKPLDHFIRSIFLFMSRINNSSFGPNLWDTSQLSMCENELQRKTPHLQENYDKKHLSSSLPLLCSSVWPVQCWEANRGNGKSMKKFICPVQC